MKGKTSAITLGRLLVALVALLPLSACYTYTDASLEAASLGTQARLRLDDDGFGRVVNQAAMNGFPIESLDMNRKGVVGQIVEVGSDNLSVRMRGTGSSMFTAEVLTSAIRSVAVRSFSKKRTLGAIVGGFVLGRTLGSGVIGGTTQQGEEVDPEYMIRIPYVSIPLVSIPFP